MPKTITLCGSTRFRQQFEMAEAALTVFEDAFVLSVACFTHNKLTLTGEQKRRLDALHKHKINRSDEIFVIDVGGYIGESTKSEITHALNVGVGVRYFSAEQADIEAEWRSLNPASVGDPSPAECAAVAAASITERQFLSAWLMSDFPIEQLRRAYGLKVRVPESNFWPDDITGIRGYYKRRKDRYGKTPVVPPPNAPVH